MGFFEDMIAECREVEADEVADALESRPLPPPDTAQTELTVGTYRPLRGPVIGDEMLWTWPERYAALCLRDHLDGGALQPMPTLDPVQAQAALDAYGNAYPAATAAIRTLIGRKPVIALQWNSSPAYDPYAEDMPWRAGGEAPGE
jgi:hypothetical protein